MYQIIRSAEQYPEADALPFRAIFAAYETVLPENGIDPDHDQVYLRFLFRLGDRREEGQTLYGSFVALLEELGLQIEFVPDEDGDKGDSRFIEATNGRRPDHAPTPQNDVFSKPSRRNSSGSMYNAQNEGTEQADARPWSRASMSRLDISQRSVLEPRPSTRATTRKTEKTAIYVSPQKPPVSQARRDRLTAEEFVRSLEIPHQRKRPKSSQPSQRKQIPAPFQGASPHTPNDTDHLDEDNDGNDSRHDEVLAIARPMQPKYAPSQHERLYNPSRTQLLRDAETFHDFRVRSIARDIVDRWCFAAIQAKNQHEHLERLAAAHDAEILLRQAFEHWRLRLHAKKQAEATERYFKHEEKRIRRARDLMLLSKAFTHWAQCASDERLRSIDARQKILSLKCFRAWRAITVANQLHIRHQGMRKFFGIWKKRQLQTLTNDVKADLVRQESITRNAYWDWFWAFCERRAPEWRIARLKRKFFTQWAAAFRNYRRQEQHAEIKAQNDIRRQAILTWRGKAGLIVSDQRKAVSFLRHNDTMHAVHSWKRSVSNAPMYQQVTNMIDWRVAGATFAIFVARYRCEKQAEAVNRLRILRTSWTQWNDRLRWQTVARRIDDRFCLEALYKWVISERHILLERLYEERLKQGFMHKLRKESAARQMHRAQSCRLIEEKRRKATLQDCLTRLHFQLDNVRKDSRIASEFRAPKLLQDALVPWTQGLKHVQELEDLAKDTCFYYTMRRQVRRWHTACLESKKQKRKNAYVQIRRKQKIKLAGNALRLWCYASARMHDFQQQVLETDRQRLFQVGITLFDGWRDQCRSRSGQMHEAHQHYERRLLEQHFYSWVEGLERQANREDLADVNHEMRIKEVAFSWFNKSRLKMIEQRGQEANAENLRIWYEKRHFRNLLRQWHDRILRQSRPQENIGFSSRMTRTRRGAIAADDEVTNQAEEWTEFDIGEWIPALDSQSSTTPLPGYLNTPSKRAARAKALVKASTTPAGTPFERRFRSQIGSTLRTAQTSGLRRSTAAPRSNAFSDIPEDSPRTPERSEKR